MNTKLVLKSFGLMKIFLAQNNDFGNIIESYTNSMTLLYNRKGVFSLLFLVIF